MTVQNTEEGQAQVTTENLQQNGSEASPEATGKTVTISGKSYNVSEDIAQALTEQSQSIDRRFDERSQELGELRQFRNTTLQEQEQVRQATNIQEPVDLGTVMYEDPNKFVGIIEDKIKNSQNQMRQEYQQAKSTESQQAAFWASMWAENPDLEKVKPQASDIISLISQQSVTQNPNLQNTKQTRDEFAQKTRDWMKGIVGTNNGDDPDNFIEGPSIPKEKKKKEPEFVRKTTKQLMEERREKKKKGKLGA